MLSSAKYENASPAELLGSARVLVRWLPERPAGTFFDETLKTTRGDAYAPEISCIGCEPFDGQGQRSEPLLDQAFLAM